MKAVGAGVVDSLVRLVLDQREAARGRKDWATADAIRDQLNQSGLAIEDSPQGPHGLPFLALTDDKGRLLWISAGRPERSSEITTVRNNHLVERLPAHELGAIGDLGFTGLDDDADNPVVSSGP